MPALPSRPQLLAHFGERDPKIAEIIRQVGPFRLRRNRRYFQVLARAIVSQQISTRAADTVFSRLVALLGTGRLTPELLAAQPEAHLRAAGLSRQKVGYLQDLSRHFLEGRLRPRRFACLDNEEIIQQLVQVRGIGRWTAEMFLIFSLNRLDVLPVDDLGLRAAVKSIYRMRRLPDARRLRLLGRRWHPFETVATWYAWRTLNPEIVKY